MTLRQEISITEIEDGLDFIIDHFDPTILYFPRKVMTKIPKVQKIIYAKEEALEYFQQSEFQDCRINAYRYSPYSSQGKDSQQWTPDLIFVDLDKNNNFKNDSNFELLYKYINKY